MEAVIKKLTDIEATAEKIVDHAKEQKSVIEKQIHEERMTFDRELEEETQATIDAIRKEADEELAKLVEQEKERHKSVIGNLEQMYEKHHEEYAKEVLENILER